MSPARSVSQNWILKGVCTWYWIQSRYRQQCHVGNWSQNMWVTDLILTKREVKWGKVEQSVFDSEAIITVNIQLFCNRQQISMRHIHQCQTLHRQNSNNYRWEGCNLIFGKVQIILLSRKEERAIWGLHNHNNHNHKPLNHYAYNNEHSSHFRLKND